MSDLGNVIDQAVQKGIADEVNHKIRQREMLNQGRDFDLAAEMVEQASKQLEAVHTKFCELLNGLARNYTPSLAGLLEIHVKGLRRPLTRCYVTILGEADEDAVGAVVDGVITDFIARLNEVKSNPALSTQKLLEVNNSDPSVLQIGETPQTYSRKQLEAMPWAELRKVGNAGPKDTKAEIINRVLGENE